MNKPPLTDLEALWVKAGVELTAAQVDLAKAAAAVAAAQDAQEVARQRVNRAMAAAIQAFNDLSKGKAENGEG